MKPFLAKVPISPPMRYGLPTHHHATFDSNILHNLLELGTMQIILSFIVMLSFAVTGIRAFSKTTSSRYVMSRLLTMRGSVPNLV